MQKTKQRFSQSWIHLHHSDIDVMTPFNNLSNNMRTVRCFCSTEFANAVQGLYATGIRLFRSCVTCHDTVIVSS
jgi:hypothetical protein